MNRNEVTINGVQYEAVAFNATSVTSHTDVIGETLDKENMGDIWESFLEAEQMAGQK